MGLRHSVLHIIECLYLRPCIIIVHIYITFTHASLMYVHIYMYQGSIIVCMSICVDMCNIIVYIYITFIHVSFLYIHQYVYLGIIILCMYIYVYIRHVTGLDLYHVDTCIIIVLP